MASVLHPRPCHRGAAGSPRDCTDRKGRTDNEAMTAAPAQPKDPLHGLTLEALLTALVARYGWAGLGERIALRCFTHEPSIGSSLKFLRKTPWAREKVEGLYLYMLRDARRKGGT